MAAYKKKTGVDLIKQLQKQYADALAKIMSIDKSKRRMDFFMVELE